MGQEWFHQAFEADKRCQTARLVPRLTMFGDPEMPLLVGKDGSVETPLGLGGWLLGLAFNGGLKGVLKNLGNAGARIAAL